MRPWVTRRQRLAALHEAQYEWEQAFNTTLHPRVSYASVDALAEAFQTVHGHVYSLWENQGSPETLEWSDLRGRIDYLSELIQEQPYRTSQLHGNAWHTVRIQSDK